MKKSRFILILLTIFFLLLSWREYNNKAPIPVFQEETKKTELKIEKSEETHEVNPIIDAVNERNSKIRTFYCKNIGVKIVKNGSRFKLNGIMFYEKKRNFRLRIRSLFGTELDMGSNKKQFWVWSKRMKPKSTLFYANHDNLYKTRLRTPFVPLWIMNVLGFNEIDVKKVERIGHYSETDKHLIITENVISPTGQPLIKKTYIDKNKKLIVGYYLYDMEGNKITITQIGYSNDRMPRKIYIRWNEENIVMDFTFYNPQVNVSINPVNFKLPRYKHAIEMGKD